MTTISLDLNETAWQYAVEKANAEAQNAFDRVEASKHAKDAAYTAQNFVPETWQAYAQRIIANLEASYATRQKREQTEAHMAIIEAQDAATIARLAKAAALPPGAERDGLAATVDALPS